VTRQVGAADLLHDAGTVPIGVGTPVAAGDRIVTGGGARLEIACRDGSVVILGERTNASLAIFRIEEARPLRRLLRLVEGILRLRVPADDADNRFEVMTETAVASVRSTHWIVDAKPDTTGVFVEDGRVAVSARHADGTVILEPGFGTDVARGEAPAPPRRWGQARIADAFARTTLP
jgi:ferric-dicitrate binding protein FerR (iron transport regulator)